MSTIRVGLVQMALKAPTSAPVAEIRDAMNDAHVAQVEAAARAGVQVLAFQEVFNQPYFCPVNDPKWAGAAEPLDGPTVTRFAPLAARHSMVIALPMYERAADGRRFNTTVVLDADGSVLGTYQKTHIPTIGGRLHTMIPAEARGTERTWFEPGETGWPVFTTRWLKLGVYTCYDRHFPEGWRALGLAGADYVVNPSATWVGLSRHLWTIEQPAAAVANGFYVGAINRVGEEAPWNIGRFYGSSYVVDPRGQILAQGPEDADALVVADVDLDVVREVRETWRFFEHRRPETYAPVSADA
ncbi:MAG: acyltransferase [Ectothiorhodospiraceae bacterium]|nr:acyltransferase [Ectothiorhodospiraceae bacterium]